MEKKTSKLEAIAAAIVAASTESSSPPLVEKVEMAEAVESAGLVEKTVKPVTAKQSKRATKKPSPKSAKPAPAPEPQIDPKTGRLPNGRKKKNPGPTNQAELEYRHHLVAEWAASGKKKWQCKLLAKEHWDLSPRQFEDYYTAAYRILLDCADTTPEIEFLKSCAYYDSVMANEENSPDVRLAARLNKDKLTGIQRPKKLAMTDASGEVVTPISSVEVLGLTMAVNRLTAANLSDDQLKKLEEASEIYATVNKIDQGEGIVTNQNGSNNSPAISAVNPH